MAFTHILHALYCEPWLITEQFHAVLAQVVEQHIGGGVHAAKLSELFTSPRPKMQIVDGIADIPIQGVIGKKLSAIEESCGACGVESVESDLQSAVDNKDVCGIMLSIDSPGGSVSGVPELGSMVSEISQKKPVMCFVDGMMCSAAYWTGAGARAIYGTESSMVGSIGVYRAVKDMSKMADQMGMKVEMFRAGKYKGAGHPGTSLSDVQREEIQSQVDHIKQMFDAHVSAYRPKIDMQKSAQGQVFIGQKAVGAGLMDSISSKSKAMADLRSISIRRLG